MFCSQCGAESLPEARFCQNCGNAMSSMMTQTGATQTIDAGIWNPNACANWSLIFTPAFGSYLQMLNWRVLGETKKEADSKNWFYISLGMLAIYVFLGFFMTDKENMENMVRGLGFLFLFIWYFSNGREQSKYVKEKFGSSYVKKPWTKTLLLSVAAIIGYLMAAAIVGIIFGGTVSA